MKRHILLTLLTALMFATAQVAVANNNENECVEPETSLQEVKVAVYGRTLHITGAEGKQAVIYDAVGNQKVVINIDGNDKVVNVTNLRGVFIVKIGNIVRKIHIS